MSVLWVLKTPWQLTNFVTHCKNTIDSGKSIAFQEVDPKRSLDQNALCFEIYKRIGTQLYGGDINLARAECKLRYGIPILRTDNEKFRAAYDRCLKSLDYETKLNFIQDTEFAVTRLMGKKQMTQYINMLFANYSQLGVDFGSLGEQTQ